MLPAHWEGLRAAEGCLVRGLKGPERPREHKNKRGGGGPGTGCGEAGRFRVWGLGFRVWALGLGFRFGVWGGLGCGKSQIVLRDLLVGLAAAVFGI